MTARLIPVKARDVKPGDHITYANHYLTVRHVESGGNRQIYVSTVTVDGYPIVLERDPGETMSVWREP